MDGSQAVCLVLFWFILFFFPRWIPSYAFSSISGWVYSDIYGCRGRSVGQYWYEESVLRNLWSLWGAVWQPENLLVICFSFFITRRSHFIMSFHWGKSCSGDYSPPPMGWAGLLFIKDDLSQQPPYNLKQVSFSTSKYRFLDISPIFKTGLGFFVSLNGNICSTGVASSLHICCSFNLDVNITPSA